MIQCVFLALALAPSAFSQLQLVASGPGVGKASESLTLTCDVSGASITSQDYAWGWVRQPPGEEPESMGGIYPYTGDTRYAPALQGRVNISADPAKNQVSLTLRSLTAADTGTYYCAGIRRDIREKLIFGKGTKVTVEPKNPETSSPSVFVVKEMKTSEDKKSTAACLVKDFYPEAVEVRMSQESEIVYKSKEGIRSSNGKYSMIQVVKVPAGEEVTCYVKHNGIENNKTIQPSALSTAPIQLPINITQSCESSNSTLEEPNMEKMNMLSVTVLGLRVLLAKSIAFNMLMTAKLFIF